MDPDVALANVRAALVAYEKSAAAAYLINPAADELAEAVEALVGWLDGGGFPPREWLAANALAKAQQPAGLPQGVYREGADL